jgi:hypothetical protein
MTEERDFDGRDITEIELDAMRRIIKQVNVEVTIEDGDIIIQAVCDETVEPIGRCDLWRVAAHAVGVVEQTDGDAGVFALAGLFSKCAQIVLNRAEPVYAEAEDGDSEGLSLGCTVRLFAGNDRENPPEPLHAV